MPIIGTKSKEECNKIWKENINRNWDDILFRCEQLSKWDYSHVPQTVSIWIEEATSSYILGNYSAACFFSGVAIEKAMVIRSRLFRKIMCSNSIKGKFKRLIIEHRERRLITKRQFENADLIRDIRNDMAHGDIAGIAKKAQQRGLKIRMTKFRLSTGGSQDVKGYEDIIDKPYDELDDLTFMDFYLPELALKCVKNAEEIVDRLFLKYKWRYKKYS